MTPPELPSAVPELPVTDLRAALTYYATRLGFRIDWEDQDGAGIAGISRGSCRLFLTSPAFRAGYGNIGPVLIWLNLANTQDVDQLYEAWHATQATILSPPAAKPWGLYEFTAADPDGNFLRVFYDFATPDQ